MSPVFLFKIIRSLVMRRGGPLYAHYGITHRCNLRCRMCAIAGDRRRYQELSLGDIEELAKALGRLGIVYVSIGGGEPCLRDDLPSVVGIFVKRGFKVRVLTNGTLVDETAVQALAAAGLREVSVSFDSLDPRTNAYICDCEDAGEKIIRGMDFFSRIIPGRGRLLLMNTVVSPLNIRELPALESFAHQKGFFISFVPIESGGIQEFTFTAAQHRLIDDSYGYLIKAKRKGRSAVFNSSVFLEKSRDYLKSGKRTWACDAGRRYVSVNPQGELSICHKFVPGIPFAGVDLGRLLRSEGFRRERDRLVRDCPGCMRPCWAETSLLFRHARSLREMSKVV